MELLHYQQRAIERGFSDEEIKLIKTQGVRMNNRNKPKERWIYRLGYNYVVTHKKTGKIITVFRKDPAYRKE